jgi:tetratricopeptide (TPR) repeat protein
MAENRENEITQKLADSFRETSRAIAENIIAAQQSNMKFAENTFTSAMEVFKNQAEATRSLMQQLEQQTKLQQEAFQKLAQGVGGNQWMPQGVEGNQWMESYMNFLRTGFSSYQQALDAAEKATRQGLDNFEKATEAFEKAAQQLPKMPGAQRANKPSTP